MSKKVIKVIIGSQKIVKKITLETKLDKFREILEDSMPENCFFNKIIEKNDEQFYSIKDVEVNNQIFCSIKDIANIKIYLNNRNISNLDINEDESIENLIKELNGKIPIDSKIKFEDTEITIKEAKNEEMTIKDIVSENSIYFIHKGNKNNENYKNNKNNENNENNEKKNKSERFIHIYKNGEIIIMGSFDININLAILRRLIKDKISEDGRFLSEGVGVPISDENNIKLFNIIKEDKIYIEELNNINKSNNYNKVEEKRIKNIDKIPIILKCDENNHFIIKTLYSEKLDKIREQNKNIINDNYYFTFQGSTISKDQENTFSIGEIMDNYNNVLLRSLRPKIKIKIMEDNKSVKSEFVIDPLQKLSKLRKELSLDYSKAFTKNSSEIEMENEDNLTVGDI